MKAPSSPKVSQQNGAYMRPLSTAWDEGHKCGSGLSGARAAPLELISVEPLRLLPNWAFGPRRACKGMGIADVPGSFAEVERPAHIGWGP